MKCGQPQPGLTHAPGRRIRRWHPLSSPKLRPGALYLCQPSLSQFNFREKRLPGFLGPSPFSNHPFLPVNPWEAYLAGRQATGLHCPGPPARVPWAPRLSSFRSLFPSTRHRRPVLSHQGPERWVWRGSQAADWLAGCRGVQEGEDFARGTWLSGLRS